MPIFGEREKLRYSGKTDPFTNLFTTELFFLLLLLFLILASGFSQWTPWSPCSRTCRYLGVAGTRRRTRYCRIPELGCVGPYKEITECNTQDCQGMQPHFQNYLGSLMPKKMPYVQEQRLILFFVFFYFLGCGERFSLNDSNYMASTSDEQPARFAALDTSNPRASQVAWCREVNNIGGFIQINLGTARLNVRLFFNGNTLLLIFESFAIVFLNSCGRNTLQCNTTRLFTVPLFFREFSRLVGFARAAAILRDHDLGRVSKLPRGAGVRRRRETNPHSGSPR